jgi:ADP-ribose pyrophosphatase
VRVRSAQPGIAGGPTETDPFDAYAALLQARPNLAETPPGGITVVTDRAEAARIEAVMADRFAAQGLPRGYARAGLMYEDPYIQLLRDAVIFPDGNPGLYHRVIARHDEPTGVAVLARHRGKFVLVRHFRHPSRRWFVEVPRGAVGAGEDPAAVAQMEISEEIGGTLYAVTRLGLLHGSTSLMRHCVVLVFGEVEAIGTPALGEGIGEILLVSGEKLVAMVRDGAITDAFTVAAAFHARLRGLL